MTRWLHRANLPHRADRFRFVLALTAAALLAPAALPAETAEEKGFRVAARSDRSDRGFGDSTVSLEMVLRNRAGKEARRELTIRTLEVPDEDRGDKSLIIFNDPADVKGTAFLSFSHGSR